MLTHETHEFPACFDEHSETLILGSFPSVKSRAMGFYYGHPQNRFWKVLAAIYQEDVPMGVESRRAFVLRHHLALYDSLEACEIHGSSDASITNVVPADLNQILDNAPIKKILLNGKTAARYFDKYQKTKTEAVVLPSTSSANAAMSFERLLDAWRKALL